MKQPIDVIAERIGAHEAEACIALLKEAGWIVVRHDAILLAQAHAIENWWREDNWQGPDQMALQRMEINN